MGDVDIAKQSFCQGLACPAANQGFRLSSLVRILHCLFDVLEVAFDRTVKIIPRFGTGCGSANAGSCGVFGAALPSNSAKTAVFGAGNSILLPGSVGGQHPSSPAERCAGTGLFRLSERQRIAQPQPNLTAQAARRSFPRLGCVESFEVSSPQSMYALSPNPSST